MHSRFSIIALAFGLVAMPLVGCSLGLDFEEIKGCGDPYVIDEEGECVCPSNMTGSGVFGVPNTDGCAGQFTLAAEVLGDPALRLVSADVIEIDGNFLAVVLQESESTISVTFAEVIVEPGNATIENPITISAPRSEFGVEVNIPVLGVDIDREIGDLYGVSLILVSQMNEMGEAEFVPQPLVLGEGGVWHADLQTGAFYWVPILNGGQLVESVGVANAVRRELEPGTDGLLFVGEVEASWVVGMLRLEPIDLGTLGNTASMVLQSHFGQRTITLVGSLNGEQANPIENFEGVAYEEIDADSQRRRILLMERPKEVLNSPSTLVAAANVLTAELHEPGQDVCAPPNEGCAQLADLVPAILRIEHSGGTPTASLGVAEEDPVYADAEIDGIEGGFADFFGVDFTTDNLDKVFTRNASAIGQGTEAISVWYPIAAGCFVDNGFVPCDYTDPQQQSELPIPLFNPTGLTRWSNTDHVEAGVVSDIFLLNIDALNPVDFDMNSDETVVAGIILPEESDAALAVIRINDVPSGDVEVLMQYPYEARPDSEIKLVTAGPLVLFEGANGIRVALMQKASENEP